MSNRFLTLVNGVITRLQAITTSAGVADANKIVSTDGTGKVNSTLLPAGIGASTKTFPATEALAAGNFVNIHDNAGVASVRKADASNSRPANGFVSAAAASGESAITYLAGENTNSSGLTVGTGKAFLSGTTPGQATMTPPTTGILQALGTPTSATSLQFEDDGYVVL